MNIPTTDRISNARPFFCIETRSHDRKNDCDPWSLYVAFHAPGINNHNQSVFVWKARTIFRFNICRWPQFSERFPNSSITHCHSMSAVSGSFLEGENVRG